MEIKVSKSPVQILVLLPVCLSLSKICQVKSATSLMSLLFMLSCLTCALTPTTDSATVFPKCGDIVPVDPFYFIGEYLNLTCTLWDVDNNKTVSLYFDMAVNNNGDWSNVEINQTGYNISQFNNTAIQLTSPVLTIDDAQRHNVTRSYSCKVREAVNDCTESNKNVVKNERVRIDYYPQNPENFSCQVYNWEKLTCRWDMIPYFHKADINVECFMTISQKLEGSDAKIEWTQCPNGSFTSFTTNDFTPDLDHWFHFNITNTVRRKVTTSAAIHISLDHIVKPAPVDFISFPNISDTCVTVVWSHSKQFQKNVFRVRYTSDCSSEQEKRTREMKITVCDLNPFTNYTFVVDSRPVKYLSAEENSLDTTGFTSDPINSSVITMPAVPAANPKLLSYVDELDTESRFREVLVYWEPLPPCDLHDSPSGQWYEIITKERGSEKTLKSVVNDSKAISQPLMLPDQGKPYDVMLRVITGSKKKREDFSHLVIWPRKQSPVAPSMIVEYDEMNGGTNFYITLNQMETSQSQTSHVLYWCHSQRGSRCEKAPSLKEINGSSTEIFIKNYMMDVYIRFGVESQQPVLGEITRSGIQMGTCIYKKNLKPLIPPKNFHIAKGISEREGELSLQWDPYDCNSREPESGYVLNYTLYYCQVTDESSCNYNTSNSISIQRDMHNYTMKKLIPGGRYKVWLTARTSAGEGPPTVSVDTYIYVQEFPLWGKVTIGVVLLIVLLAIIICIAKTHQYIKSRREEFSRIQIAQSNGHMWQNNGHVIVDDQSAELIPDMDENEELGEIIPLQSNGEAKFSMNSDSSRTNLLLASSKDGPNKKQLDMPLLDIKDDGSYIFSNDNNSSSSDTESHGDIKAEKEIKLCAFVLLPELGHQTTNLLPEGYCRAVGYEDYVPNDKTNPALNEDMLDNKFLKIQGQAVHSQSIDSLLNDFLELQGLPLDQFKGNCCERDKDVDSLCVEDSSNLPQENVTIEKKIEPGWMKSKHDFESDELVPSGDDDAASEDSLSLWDDICRSFDKIEKTNGYVCADEVLDEDGELLLSNSYFSFDGSHLDEVSSGSDEDHVRSEPNSVRSENDHVTSDMINTDFFTVDNNNDVRCDDDIASTANNTRTSLDEQCDFSKTNEKSCVDSDDHNSDIENDLSILQNVFAHNQECQVMDPCFSQSQNSGPDTLTCPSNNIYAIEVVPNGFEDGMVRFPLDFLGKKVGKDSTSRNGYTCFPTA
ncbi:hypothetical protein ACJMK2_042273 [Sinanodonta woodiana]|uniref:Fibronectin type-III domain-containing protein n=1 Tax=Sinanodonta woodiana TaxID=1069815 RepID=A0ABD3W880_SINWO